MKKFLVSMFVAFAALFSVTAFAQAVGDQVLLTVAGSPNGSGLLGTVTAVPSAGRVDTYAVPTNTCTPNGSGLKAACGVFAYKNVPYFANRAAALAGGYPASVPCNNQHYCDPNPVSVAVPLGQ